MICWDISLAEKQKEIVNLVKIERKIFMKNNKLCPMKMNSLNIIIFNSPINHKEKKINEYGFCDEAKCEWYDTLNKMCGFWRVVWPNYGHDGFQKEGGFFD